METSKDALIFSKMAQLPESLKSEVLDFIDFLMTKKVIKKNKVSETKRAFGSMKGKIVMAPDFDEPLEDFKDYM